MKIIKILTNEGGLLRDYSGQGVLDYGSDSFYRVEKCGTIGVAHWSCRLGEYQSLNEYPKLGLLNQAYRNIRCRSDQRGNERYSCGVDILGVIEFK